MAGCRAAAPTARHYALTPTPTTITPTTILPINRPSAPRTLARSSQTVFSVIAAIASTSAGSPLASDLPEFLCPSLEAQIPQKFKRQSSKSIAKNGTSKKRYDRIAEIPDKYEKGPDGRWRLVSKVSLYGSVICRSCPSPGVDDASVVESSPTSTVSTPAASAAVASQIQQNDAMPPAWVASNNNKSNPDRTTLILAVSISLAFFIAFIMLVTLIWRKRKRKSKMNAIEMQPRIKSTTTATTDDASVVVQDRAWSRATARWRATAKLSARRRRGPRIGQSKNSVTTENSQNRRSSSDSSSTDRCSISIRRSSDHPDSLNPEMTDHSINSPSRPPSTMSFHPSPPAYVRTHSSTSSITHRSRSVTEDGETRHSLPPHDFYLSAPSAHVATDDKAVLARMERMASAPVNQGDWPESSSAPVLYEDSMDDYVIPADYSHDHSHLPLPPRPLKQGYLSPFSDEYAAGPSAPPFEEAIAPSAPPLDNSDALVASAPPEDDDDDELVPHSGPSRFSLPVYHA